MGGVAATPTSGTAKIFQAKTKSPADKAEPSCQTRFGFRRYVVSMVPSGKIFQLSELSWGRDSARYGSGRPCSSRRARSALNIRLDKPSDTEAFSPGPTSALILGSV